jgi:hypothetical protein
MEEAELLQRNKQLAASQKLELGDLFLGRRRPDSSCDELYIVPTSFVIEWKKFIR